MKVLTVNVLVDDTDVFFENNSCVASVIGEINDFELKVYQRSECKYNDFLKALMQTDSLYVAFYDDENVLKYKDLECLTEYLRKCNEPVLAQKLLSEKTIDSSFFYTGAMQANSLYFNRYIFESESLKKINILEKEKDFFEEKIILTMTRNEEKIPLVAGVGLETNTKMELNVNLYLKQFMYEWYIPFFEDFILPYVKGKALTQTEQRLIVYFIMIRFYLNLNDRDKHILEGEQINYFFDLVRETLHHIDDKYLFEISKRKLMHKYFPYLLLKEKNGKIVFENECKGDKINYFLDNSLYGEDVVKIRIALFEYKKNTIRIEGEIVGDYCIEDIDNDIRILLNGKGVSFSRTERYNLSKEFGKTIYRYYPFACEIHEDNLEIPSTIIFQLRVGKKYVQLPIEFDKVSSRLVRSRWSYYKFSNKMVSFSKDRLLISEYKSMRVLLNEIMMAVKTVKNDKNKKRAFSSLKLKCLYWITQNKYCNKNIWIFYDKLYKAGDNAEYLFRYSMENVPEVECYYILNKTANEYKALRKKYGKHIVPFNSTRSRLMVLNSRIIFATHATVMGFCGFGATLRRQFKHLLNAKVVCIQHGLTIQNIAQYQNKLKDNTQLYFCASKYEIENLRRPIYGYTQEDLCLTGCPRYDGLVNNDKKQILIAPTWRRNIVITGNKMGSAKSYNPEFKHTQYFEIYNRLINDKRLLRVASEHGYKIVFLIHPTLSAQVEDYQTNSFLSIVPAISEVSYEKMLTESSLMLTDYSGIQFDFAYMKKPVLYYQPKELPPQYTEGVYEYDTMGFGPIIEEYNDIIDALCQYIKKGCGMEEIYKQRVDDFFEYTDHENCKRIIDVINAWRV